MRSILFILMVLGLAMPAWAEPVEVKATVMTVQGKAWSYEGQAGQALKPGQLLAAGNRVVTETGARVKLVMADGSSLSLGENTDLTLTEMSQDGDKRSTVFSVFKGMLKATVNKLTFGSRFELETKHGVAAVKGTEYEATVDDDGMEVKVREGKVWMEDRKRERHEEVAERHAGRCKDGRLERPREVRKEEWKALERRWGRVGADRHMSFHERRMLRRYLAVRTVEALKESLGDTWDDLLTLRDDQRQEKWRESLRAADEFKLANAESRIDLMLGKTLTDVHGVRVRMQEYLMRPNPNEMQFLNYSKRENRTDAVSCLNRYNTDLPRDLREAQGLGLKVWDYQPRYWVIYQNVWFQNDQANSLQGETGYFDPVRVGIVRPRWELPQRWTKLSMNDTKPGLHDGILLYQTERVRSAATVAGQTYAANTNLNTAVGTGTSVGLVDAVASDMSQTGGRIVTAVSEGAQNPGSGDWSYVTNFTFSGTPFGGGASLGAPITLTIKSWAIDQNGQVRNSFDLIKDKSLFQAWLDVVFRTYKEFEISSSAYNGNTIDIVSRMLWWSDLARTKDSL